MTHKHLSGALALLLLLSGHNLYAAKPDGETQGDNHGKPFQELNAVISENRALIEANQADIADLQLLTDAINDAVANLENDLSTLEDRVTDNEDNITALQFRINNLEADVGTLNAELDQLRADHEADVADINAAVADAEARITILENSLQDLTDSINSQLSTLQGQVDDNTLAIDQLLLDLAATSAQATANLVAIGNLENRVEDLEARAGQHEADIDDLQDQIDALAIRVGTNEDDIAFLKGLHNVDAQCFEPYNTLSASSRNVAFNDGNCNLGNPTGNVEMCDSGVSGQSLCGDPAQQDWQGPGWYRISGDAGSRLPEFPPTAFSCGTDSPGWLNGIHPDTGDGVVTRQACFNWAGDQCRWSTTIEVVNCGEFVLYHLNNPPVSCLRYCGE